jgi:hypothetical protein
MSDEDPPPPPSVDLGSECPPENFGISGTRALAEDYVRTCPVEELFALLWLAEGRLNPGGGGE